jgi:hypothetical protein
MKLKFLSLVAAAALIASSCGTTYNSTSDNAAYRVNVPTNIRNSFAVAYPDATVVIWDRYDAATVPIDWELTGWQTLDADDYVVTYKMGDDQYYSWYDSNGTLVGTAYAIGDYTKLPYSVNQMLADKYKGYTIETVQREIYKSQAAYEIKLKGIDDTKIKLLVDANGNVLKEKLK